VSLAFGAAVSANASLGMISNYMDEELCSIRTLLRTDFLRLVKTAGCDERYLMQIDDSRLVDQMLGNIVFSGNGINSVKSILQKSLLAKQFLSFDTKTLHDHLDDLILENIRLYTNANYLSSKFEPDGTERPRLVDQTAWINSQAALMPEIMAVVDGIMSFAKEHYREEK
jgi:hypothetical protein